MPSFCLTVPIREQVSHRVRVSLSLLARRSDRVPTATTRHASSVCIRGRVPGRPPYPPLPLPVTRHEGARTVHELADVGEQLAVAFTP